MCGLVLANVSTSLAQSCCAHFLWGSGAEAWHASTESLPVSSPAFLLSSISLSYRSFLPCALSKWMVYSVICEWNHHWQGNELVFHIISGILSMECIYPLHHMLFYPLSHFDNRPTSFIYLSVMNLFLTSSVSLWCLIATLAQVHCSPAKPSSTICAQ